MQRYVPPGRRRDGGGDAASEQRGLDGAAPRLSQVRLVLLKDKEGGYDVQSCPLDTEAEEGGSSFQIFFPERLPTELLRWFGQQFPDGAGWLEFPATLSKQERARWHGAAQRLHLVTQSVGIGEERHLTVTTAAAPGSSSNAEGEQGAGTQTPSRQLLSSEQVARARLIYDACQMEGGKYWEYSRGEVEAMVASGQPLPQDLQALVDRREKGERVHQLLKDGQPSQALELLLDDSKLAWIKDSRTGGYPIHQAAWKGYESVVLYLASLPGVLEQRDGRRDTALAIARQRRHSALEQQVLEAGAKPEHASFQHTPAGGGSAQAVRGEGWGAAAARAGAAAGAAAGGQGDQDEQYSSWTAAERYSYRHGGSRAPPPGLSGRGRGRSRNSGGRGSTEGNAPERQRPACPW